MAISNAAQFGLLLWKNWLLQKRRIVLTIFKILLPALIALVLLGIRFLVDSTFISTPTNFDSFDVSTLPANLTLPPNRTSTLNLSYIVKRMLAANLTLPDLDGLDPNWMLVYSPNTSRAATEMAFGMTRMLNMTPFPIGIISLMFTVVSCFTFSNK